MPFFIPLIVGATVGGVTSVAMGGDFLRGAGMGLLTGGVGALAGGSLAGAGAATATATVGETTVSVFGHELTKQALYSLAGAVIGGTMSGMSVAQQTKAERRMKQEQEAYVRREKELREMEQRHSEEARRSLANFEEGSRRELARRGAELRSAEDANTAFWRYLNEWGNDNRTLTEVVEEQYIQSAYA